MLGRLLSCVGLLLALGCTPTERSLTTASLGDAGEAGKSKDDGGGKGPVTTGGSISGIGVGGSSGEGGLSGSLGAAGAIATGGAPQSSGGSAGATGLSCTSGMKVCAEQCVALTDPNFGCGSATCDASGCPNPGPGGALACDGSACRIGSCATGFKLCNDACVAASDPTYGCSKTSCDASACPAAGSGTLVCEGESCVVGTCGAGTKKCGNKCVPTDRNNGCASAATCTACLNNEDCAGSPSECTCQPIAMSTACAGKCGGVSNGCGGSYTCGGCTSPQTCGGGNVANVCGCTPVSMSTACSGKSCGSVSNGCGGTYTCGTCTAQANAVATCQSNTCVNSCAPGIMPLTCPNISAGTARCGAWSFETSTVEGWTKGDPSDAAITGKTTITTSTSQKVDGSRALMITTTIPGGENPTTFDYEQQITFQAPLCPDGSSLNLSNRVFEVHAFFERISGTALTSANAKITAGSQQQNTGGTGGGVGSSPFSVAEGVWLSGTAQVSVAASHLTITVAVIPRLATPWNGRIYLDVLALH